MAPTRRSTRAKSTDKVVAGPSPSTRATRARPATKTGSPAAKSRTKQPRKTASKAQAILEAKETEEEEEEEEQEKVQEKQKPKAKSTRRGVAKAQTVPRAEEEEEEEKEVISQEEIEGVVAAATRRSNRAASVASLQTPTKSKAARGRVAKKVAPARKTRGAVVEEEEEVVPEVTHTKTSRGRKPHIETTNSPVTTSTEILDAVVVKSRSKRQDAKKLKNLIEEPAVAEDSVDASATPSWAKKRGGKKAKVVGDEAADSNLDQHTGAEMELAKVDDVEDTSIKDTEPEPVVAKGRGRKKGMKAPEGEAVVEELETTIEVVKSEPALKGRGSRKGKKAEAIPEESEAIAEEIAVGVAEPEPVSKGKSKRDRKAGAVPEGTIIEDTTIEDTKPEPAPKGRGGKKGRKVDAVSKEPQVIVEVAQPEPVLKGRVGRRGKQVDPVTEEPEDIIEEAAIVAETEAPKGRSKRGKKADAVPEETVTEDTTIEVTKPEPAPKGRGSRRGNKIDAVIETAVDLEPVVAKGKGRGKGKKVVEEIEAIAEEPESVVEEPRPVPAKGTGRRKGNKVDAVVAEPEPEPVAEDTEPESVVAKRKGGKRAAKAVEGTEAAVEALKITVEDVKTEVSEAEPLLPKGRGRNRGKQAVQVEITDTSVNQTAVDAGTEIEKADAVVEATFQEPQIIGDTQIMVTEEPAVKSKVRGGKKVVSAKKGTRGGRRVVAELPDVEMSDTDVQTQETEVDVEMEPIAAATATTTSPNVKDSGVFLENEFMVGGPSFDKPEHITEGTNVTAVEESAVVAEVETEVVGPELNVVSEAEPILTVQSEVTVKVDTEVTAIQPVVVGSSTGQIREIADEIEVGVPEPSNLLAKSPGSSRKKTPRGKETTQVIVSVEQDVEMGEPSVGGEKYGPNIELESALEKSSTDIEMPVSDVGVEPKEAVRAPKPRKKAKRPSTAIKKERQAKFVARKVRGSSSGGFEALDTSSDIFFDGIPSENIEKKEVKEAEGEEVMTGRELVEDEEGEPDLPQPFSSPVTKPTIILSPRRASPDPDLDPIKTPVPSSPIDHRMSHPLNSSPLRQNGPDPVVLASPRMVTTPSNSPSKKRSTPNTRTPINRLPGSGIPFGRNLEDSRDVRSITTPARGRNSSVASSPIMMPPATPNVVAGDARSPTKQTPTKESEVVGDMLDRVDEPSMLIGSITNINSSPVKNSTPIRTGYGIKKSSPVGRLNFGGSDISQSSPLVGRLQISDPSLLLSSPLAVPSKTFSPTKAQQNSPTRSSPLKHSPLGKPNLIIR